MNLKVLTDQEIEKLTLSQINEQIRTFGTALNQQMRELEQAKAEGLERAEQGIKYMRDQAGSYNQYANVDGTAGLFNTEYSTERRMAIERLKVLMRTYNSAQSSVAGIKRIMAKTAETISKQTGHHVGVEDLDVINKLMQDLKNYDWNSEDIYQAYQRELDENKFDGNWDEFLEFAKRYGSQSKFNYAYDELEV